MMWTSSHGWLFSSAVILVSLSTCPSPGHHYSCLFLALVIFLRFSVAHHPSSGFACAERNPEEPASALQKLCRAHHHEDPGGSQRLSQGGAHKNRPWNLWIMSSYTGAFRDEHNRIQEINDSAGGFALTHMWRYTFFVLCTTNRHFFRKKLDLTS